MKRRGRVPVVFSLLVCFTSLVFWARSWTIHGYVNGIRWEGSREYWIASAFGTFAFGSRPLALDHPMAPTQTRRHRFLGFGIARQWFGSESTWAVVAPYWPITTLSLVLPLRACVVTLRERRAQARIKSGLCAHCGYDLRSSNDRCPECGRVIERTALGKWI